MKYSLASIFFVTTFFACAIGGFLAGQERAQHEAFRFWHHEYYTKIRELRDLSDKGIPIFDYKLKRVAVVEVDTCAYQENKHPEGVLTFNVRIGTPDNKVGAHVELQTWGPSNHD